MAGSNLVTVFGILGNVSSFIVFLSPIFTFVDIFKQKSTREYDCVPYIVALFSSILWLYYAILKMTSQLLISINAIGCIIETVYITIYIYYANHNIRIHTAKILSIFLGIFVIILTTTIFIDQPQLKEGVVGYIGTFSSIAVFSSPLRVVCGVVRTRSVQYMPFGLSLSLTVCSIMWLAYGLLKQDWAVATPNFIGVFLGIIQIVLYLVIRFFVNRKTAAVNEV